MKKVFSAVKATIKPKKLYINISNKRDKLYGTYKANKNNAQKQLINYIDILYKYLNASKLCFVSGSFVIEDKDETLLDLLIQSSSMSLESMESHTGFNPQPFTKQINGITYVSSTIAETHIKGKFEIKCDYDNALSNETKQIKNIKWYKFTLDEKQNTLIFLKLEDSITCSAEHCIKAAYHHGFNKPAVTLYPTRREDCAKSGCNTKDTSFRTNVKSITINNTPTISINENEKYTRLGDELFIPQDLNDYILQKSFSDDSKQTININYDKYNDAIDIIGGKNNSKKN